MFDLSGEVIGINTVIYSPSGGSIGIGFAIPSALAQPIIEQLRAGETPTHARLGIQVSNSAGQAGSSDTTLSGARIEEIERGSAAADAGLEAGDVITRIDDHQIEDTEGLIATVRSYRPGDTVTVTFQRGGDARTAELRLGSDG